MALCSYFSVIICNQYVAFMTATAEFPFSHKYIDTRGRKPFTALSDNIGYSFFTSTRNWKLSASEMSFSFSQVVIPETLLVGYGFLTHSNFETSSLKDNENVSA